MTPGAGASAAMRLELKRPAAWLRRHAPAVGGAVLVNAALLGAMVLLEREAKPAPEAHEIVVTLLDLRPQRRPTLSLRAAGRELPLSPAAVSRPPLLILRPAAIPPPGAPPP